MIKLQQNSKNHRPKNKTAPTCDKKPLFKKIIISTIQNYLSKLEIEKNQIKIFKKTNEKN
jgi:hypothetical protein